MAFPRFSLVHIYQRDVYLWDHILTKYVFYFNIILKHNGMFSAKIVIFKLYLLSFYDLFLSTISCV